MGIISQTLGAHSRYSFFPVTLEYLTKRMWITAQTIQQFSTVLNALYSFGIFSQLLTNISAFFKLLYSENEADQNGIKWKRKTTINPPSTII